MVQLVHRRQHWLTFAEWYVDGGHVFWRAHEEERTLRDWSTDRGEGTETMLVYVCVRREKKSTATMTVGKDIFRSEGERERARAMKQKRRGKNVLLSPLPVPSLID